VDQGTLYRKHGCISLVSFCRFDVGDFISVVADYALHTRRGKSGMKPFPFMGIALLVVAYLIGAKYPGVAQKVFGMIGK
jgi:hypothetical protein